MNFLVSDISYINKKFNYNCYIPKNNRKCNISTLEQLINPFKEVFIKIFGLTNDQFSTSSNISDLIDNIYQENENSITSDNYITLDLCSNNCFRNEKNVLLPKTNYFGFFYSQFLDISSSNDVLDNYFTQTIQDEISNIEQKYSDISLNNLIYDLSLSLKLVYVKNNKY